MEQSQVYGGNRNVVLVAAADVKPRYDADDWMCWYGRSTRDEWASWCAKAFGGKWSRSAWKKLFKKYTARDWADWAMEEN